MYTIAGGGIHVLETGSIDKKIVKSSVGCTCSRMAAFTASSWLPEQCAFMEMGRI